MGEQVEEDPANFATVAVVTTIDLSEHEEAAPPCGAHHGVWICTRAQGHGGAHRAWVFKGKPPAAVWEGPSPSPTRALVETELRKLAVGWLFDRWSGRHTGADEDALTELLVSVADVAHGGAAWRAFEAGDRVRVVYPHHKGMRGEVIAVGVPPLADFVKVRLEDGSIVAYGAQPGLDLVHEGPP